MSNQGRLAFMIVTLLVLPTGAFCKECTPADVKQADQQDAGVSARDWTWQKLYESFRRFGHCANSKNSGIWDAELATTYDGAVQHLLIDEWKRVSELGRLSERHAAFRGFVLSHINEAFPLDGAETLVANARDHCPASYDSLCRAIERAAEPIRHSK